jgi:glycoprotein-N-acetylgalactosamine 3-beta-galactosyltransferase
LLGACYILSKKALIKFADLVKQNKTGLVGSGQYEDLLMSQTLAHSAIFVDCRDELLQNRFFVVTMKKYFFPDYHKNQSSNAWFDKTLYHNYSGGLSCCSDVPISFHYIQPKALYLLDFLIYDTHPFGIEKNLTESLPRKLTLDEIIKASDAKSNAPGFVDHTDYHNMSSSEMFK